VKYPLIDNIILGKKLNTIIAVNTIIADLIKNKTFNILFCFVVFFFYGLMYFSYSLNLFEPVYKDTLDFGCKNREDIIKLIDIDNNKEISDFEFNRLIDICDYNSTGAIEGFEFRIFTLTTCRYFMDNFDKDKNGQIDKNEYVNVISAIDYNCDKKCSKEEISRFFLRYNHCVLECFDLNRDGKISDEEWNNITDEFKQSKSVCDSSGCFLKYLRDKMCAKKDFIKFFDKDNDLLISDKEWQFFYELAEKYRLKIIDKVDKNKNKIIEENEKKALFELLNKECFLDEIFK
jgi:Ca2+-binding EF-hand superfamily protein